MTVCLFGRLAVSLSGRFAEGASPPKKCSLIIDFFHKVGGGGDGGFRGNPKVLGHFLCTNNLGIRETKHFLTDADNSTDTKKILLVRQNSLKI